MHLLRVFGLCFSSNYDHWSFSISHFSFSILSALGLRLNASCSGKMENEKWKMTNDRSDLLTKNVSYLIDQAFIFEILVLNFG